MRKFAYVVIICLLTACQKHRSPSVTILTPINGQIFQIGDTVNIQAELSDADILMSEYLTIVSGKDYLDTTYKFTDHAQRASYTLAKQFSVQTNDTFKIIVEAFGGSSILMKTEILIRTR